MTLPVVPISIHEVRCPVHVPDHSCQTFRLSSGQCQLCCGAATPLPCDSPCSPGTVLSYRSFRRRPVSAESGCWWQDEKLDVAQLVELRELAGQLEDSSSNRRRRTCQVLMTIKSPNPNNSVNMAGSVRTLTSTKNVYMVKRPALLLLAPPLASLAPLALMLVVGSSCGRRSVNLPV